MLPCLKSFLTRGRRSRDGCQHECLAFQPREDPMITRLLDLGLRDSLPDADPTNEPLMISSNSRHVVDLIMAERQRTPT